MNLKLSDLIIMSDVDGTLVHMGGPIPPRNIQALERFVSKGGRFAISTGRGRDFTRPLVEQLPVNFPCVIFNGGALYDFKTDQYLMEMDLPPHAADYILDIMQRFPGCAAIAVTPDDYLDVDGTAARYYGDVYPNKNTKLTSLSQLKGTLMKGLMFLQPQWTDEFYAYVKEKAFPGVRFVSTNAHLIEMLPEGSSKGNALSRLIELTGVRREQLVAIGDYYNDKEMIELAGIGVTMHSAPEDLKALAQLLVCDCQEGSLGDLVEQLEARFE